MYTNSHHSLNIIYDFNLYYDSIVQEFIVHLLFLHNTSARNLNIK